MNTPTEFNPVILYSQEVKAVFEALVRSGEEALVLMLATKTLRDESDRKFIENIPRLSDGQFSTDDVPIVSRGNDGAYVSTWVWVPDEAAGLAPNPEGAEEPLNAGH